MWLGSKLTALSDYLFKTFFRVLFRYDIFISYARSDGHEYALKLRDQLRQLDFSCFLDFDELPPGNSLNRTLRRALRRSATLVLVGTERAATSRYVELEVGEFAQTGRAIIPIAIEGSLASAPWPVVRERDLVWIDEVRAALERGVPSPNVADQIDKLFKYTRRNSRVRAQVLATVGLFVVVVAVSLLLLRSGANALAAASERARQQETEARAQTKLAVESAAFARAQKEDAERQRAAADGERQRAERARGEAQAAELRAGEAAAEAKRQEQAALLNAARARDEQERAERQTRIVRAQQAGVHAGLAFDAGAELEHGVLLSVESLRRELTPEGYSAWARGMELLPRPLAADYGPGGGGGTALAYSPDGRWLAEGGRDGSVTLRRAGGAGGPVPLLPPVGGRVINLAFVRGGAWVAAASDREFGLWDVKTGRAVAAPKRYEGVTAAFSPDGRYVAATRHGSRVIVYETGAPSKLALEDERQKLVLHVMAVAFTPDSRWLVAACSPGKLLAWETAGLAAEKQPPPRVLHETKDFESYRQVAFSRDGQHLAALSASPFNLTVWRVSHDRGGAPSLSKAFEAQVASLPNFDHRKWSLAFSPDSAYLAIAAKDNTARVWSLETRREVMRAGFGQGVDEVAFSPNGHELATLSGGVVSFWKTVFGPAPVRLAHASQVEGLTISPDRRWLATRSRDGVRVFRAPDWSPAAVLAEAGAASGLSFSPDGRWLVAEGEKKLVIYDPQTWRAVRDFGDLRGKATFSRDGCWLVVATGALVRLFECDSWREARVLPHAFPVEAVASSPDGLRLSVTAESPPPPPHSGAKQVRRTYVWEVASGLLLACGATTLVSGSEEPEKAPGTEAAACPDTERSPHEGLLGEAQDWARRARSADMLGESLDGRWLGRIGRRQVFELAFREVNAVRIVARPRPNDLEHGWTFTPDSRWLAVADGPSVTLWPLRPADMIAEACARLRRRELTEEEWRQYFSDEPRRPTCGP